MTKNFSKHNPHHIMSLRLLHLPTWDLWDHSVSGNETYFKMIAFAWKSGHVFIFQIFELLHFSNHWTDSTHFLETFNMGLNER